MAFKDVKEMTDRELKIDVSLLRDMRNSEQDNITWEILTKRIGVICDELNHRKMVKLNEIKDGFDREWIKLRDFVEQSSKKDNV